MRKLLLMRGLPGSGKSTFIRENGLEPYTLAPDTIRSTFGGPIYEASGNFRIPAENDKAVWQFLFERLENRMRRGELIIVDATHSHPRSFGNYLTLTKKYRYQTIMVDFANIPFETSMERNAGRAEYMVVPPKEMERMNDNMQRSVIPKWITVIKPEQLAETLRVDPIDVSEYKKVHHIGDIQGCFDPLNEYFEKYDINDDELYIFAGDLLDRGTQNAEVMKWVLENYQRKNFIFVEGNHEAHLRNWTQGSKARSREFNLVTMPQLEGAMISPKKVHGMVYKFREMFYYKWNDRTVLVTHGGLSAFPQNLAFVASDQLIRGAGAYEESEQADATFAETAPKNTYQIHGHRNRYSVPTQVNERCFNLEGKVEFGGELRAVTLSDNGFELRNIKSNIDATETVLDAVGDLPARNQTVDEMLTAMRASKSIYEKEQDGTNISSFNFKRDVFFDKSWDSLNVHARGLFINTKMKVIVARAYEKFFNVGERPETQPDVLMRSLKFPVKAWVKENGYLGLVGYDPESDEYVFASKSSLTSDFAHWLKGQFEQLVHDEIVRKEIKLYLKSEGGKTLVFEVIEPGNDPHIIDYAKPKIVLLDIVNNTVEFKARDEKERAKLAKMMGCETKRSAAVLKNAAELDGWLRKVKDFDYLHADEERIEGFVLEDTEGFMTKVKLPWYAFWRQMRTQLQRLQTGKKSQLPMLDINNALAADFLEYMNSKTQEELQGTSILKLRHEFRTMRDNTER